MKKLKIYKILILVLIVSSCSTSVSNHQKCMLKVERKNFDFLEQTKNGIKNREYGILYTHSNNLSGQSKEAQERALSKNFKTINIKIFNINTKEKVYSIVLKAYFDKILDGDSEFYFVSHINYEYEYCENIKKCYSNLVYGGLRYDRFSLFAISLDFFTYKTTWSSVIELRTFNTKDNFEFSFTVSKKFIKDKKHIKDLFDVGEDYEVEIESDAKVLFS